MANPVVDQEKYAFSIHYYHEIQRPTIRQRVRTPNFEKKHQLTYIIKLTCLASSRQLQGLDRSVLLWSPGVILLQVHGLRAGQSLCGGEHILHHFHISSNVLGDTSYKQTLLIVYTYIHTYISARLVESRNSLTYICVCS